MSSLVVNYNFTGNHSGYCNVNNGADYCTVFAFPYFDTIKAGETNYTLRIPINDDSKIEATELIRVYVVPPPLPHGIERCYSDILIEDNDCKFLI